MGSRLRNDVYVSSDADDILEISKNAVQKLLKDQGEPLQVIILQPKKL
ncbi:MAG: hypothetical protein MUO60_15485 [Clostridiaceae bacterium]|nr:hypothetical protein [Clostridiaceae bacterium]